MTDKNFVNGLIVKRHEKAPSFVVCALSFKTDEFSDYMDKNKSGGWLNVDVKLSKNGKYYAELNTYKQSGEKAKVEQEEDNQTKVNNLSTKEEDIDPADIPF